MIEFVAYGLPAPQGSKNRWGAEDNPRTRPWRAAIAAEAAAAMQGRELLRGAVELAVVFVFPRPKAHFGSGRNAGVLRQGAPDLVAKAPDLDKLARAVADSCSGIVFSDDAQIAHLDVWKFFGELARAQIKVRPLDSPNQPDFTQRRAQLELVREAAVT